jgi:CRP-like cAMP-binding protein
VAFFQDDNDGGPAPQFDFQTILFESGYVIVEEGEPSDACYIIKSGEAEVLRRSGVRLVRIARLYRGHIFGEMSVITGEPYSATVRAGSGLECYIIYKPQFDALLNLENRFTSYVLRTLVRRVQRVTTLAYGIKDEPV